MTRLRADDGTLYEVVGESTLGGLIVRRVETGREDVGARIVADFLRAQGWDGTPGQESLVRDINAALAARDAAHGEAGGRVCRDRDCPVHGTHQPECSDPPGGDDGSAPRKDADPAASAAGVRGSPSPPCILWDECAVTLMVDGLLQSIANLYSNVPSALEQAKRDGEKFRTALAALLDRVAREAQEDMRRRCVDSLQTPVGGVPAERITPRPWADIEREAR